MAAAVPFTRFSGSVKQLVASRLTPEQREAFTILFPRVLDRNAATPSERAEWEAASRRFAPLMQVTFDDERPRRWAGIKLPYERYFTVSEPNGIDHDTLVHELRAYRNGRVGGMIEVIDLRSAINVTLGFEDATFEVRGGEPEIGVIVHDPQRVPPVVRQLPHETFRTRYAKPILVRFPYTFRREQIEKVVDLRLPRTRDWFFETFSKPQEGIPWPESYGLPEVVMRQMDPTVALSRFRLATGRAEIPTSFEAMLPTLLNPDLGGGYASTTGSTIQSIAHWLRMNGADALIYPSARCDVAVQYDHGRDAGSWGWCLVDYRGADPGPYASCADSSPWCWTSLPKGVSVALPEPGSPYAGSFQIRGMVNYWALDYIGQVTSLAVATSALFLPRLPSEISRFEAWVLGAFLLRWVQHMCEQKPAEDVEQALHIARGLAVRHDLYSMIGLLDELSQEVARTGDVQHALSEVLGLAERVERHFERMGRKEIADVIHVAVEFSTLTLLLSGVGQKIASPSAFPHLAFASGALPAGWTDAMTELSRRAAAPASDYTSLLHEAEDLERRIGHALFAEWRERAR